MIEKPIDVLPSTEDYLRRQVDCLKAELAVTQLAHMNAAAERDRLRVACENSIDILNGKGWRTTQCAQVHEVLTVLEAALAEETDR